MSSIQEQLGRARPTGSNASKRSLYARLARAVLPALLAALSPSGAHAEDVQQWHWVQGDIGITRKFSVMLHTQRRSNMPMGEFWQGRAGPIGFYSFRPGQYLVGGYYYRRERAPVTGGNGDSHRLFGGMQNYFFTPDTAEVPKIWLESRLLTERFFGGPLGTQTNYTRVRYRGRASFADWKVSPMIGHEIFFDFGVRPGDRGGLWAHRPHAGVRWRPTSNIMLDVGYYYDGRRPRVGSTSHLIFTNLLIRLRTAPGDDFPTRPTF